jgi:hypothetical protein
MVTQTQPYSSVQSLLAGGSSAARRLETLASSRSEPSPAGNGRLAQAAGTSVVLSKGQVLELNPQWPGTAAATSDASGNQIETIGRQLGDAKIVSKPKTPDDTAVLMKPIRLADGIVLPVGTKVTGKAAPGADGYPVDQSGTGPMTLKFELPNGSSIEFKAAEAKSGLGATNVEIVDKGTGKTTRAQFRAALFLDTKTNSLSFINGPAEGKFRVSDFRTQTNALTGGPAGKAALGAAVKQIGLGQL